jgi:hypothetical protein
VRMLSRNACWTAVAIAVTAATGWMATPVQAQEAAPADLFDDFAGENVSGSGTLSIQDFTLMGESCPDRSSTAAMIQERAGGATLRIEFNRGGSPFQVSAPGTATRSCTVRLQLRSSADRALNVSLGQVSEGVSFADPTNRAQLVVRSQFQFGNDVSTVRAIQLQSGQNTSPSNLLLNGFDVRARVVRTFTVRAIVQLQAQGQDSAVLRLDNLVLALQFGGGGQNRPGDDDPFVRRRN